MTPHTRPRYAPDPDSIPASPGPRRMRFARFGRISAVVMLVLSVVLLLWQHFGMNRTIRIDAHSPYRVQISDDRVNGGASVARLVRKDGFLLLYCRIATSYDWPFCEMSIRLAPAESGIDLSRFDTVTLALDYDAPGSRQLRFFVRNFDPAYGKAKQEGSWKANEISFVPALDGAEKTIPLSSFNVSAWWLAEYRIPVEHAGPDMHRVPQIQLSTSGLKEAGEHVLRVRYIAFHGKWISREQMALLLVALWVGGALLALLLDLHHLRQRLRRSRRREDELRSLTKALQLENKVIGEMARRDPLTGVRNRAGIRDELLREAELAQQDSRPLAVLFVDLDHFKQINDKHGHDTGDIVLKQFTREVDALIRQGDYLVRWGGEEFVIICPGTPLDAAAQMAEKIRTKLAELSWHDGLVVTCSFGVTVLGNESIAECLRRADAALYDAKRNGRNRVEVRTP
ncbi:diguanylate cyclase [Chitiniphilus purpureus]|uniref:diguanylate cyclase n=1 Tax=Chitiniphilus purpureus TaxID=2981137 RepID=A0ABY6DJL7_9NEIS|nr:diguanylate cyclase [Chitiniphilus sp. CD1]UXY14550.1 diguanylate cyclase [Chitiniphilus sp. CD1]